jgi:broad specificity phosphatase PhoE
MRNIVWIRHAEKKFKNGYANNIDEYQHDPGILNETDTIKKIQELTETFKTIYGEPKKIIVSPFLRTRETSMVMTNYLKEKYNITPNIEYSSDIAEFLGFCKKIHNKQLADLTPETKKFFSFPIYLGESLNHFNKRVEKHIKNIQNEKENIWVICHGIVISNILKFFNHYEKERPKPLDYIVLEKNNLVKSF